MLEKTVKTRSFFENDTGVLIALIFIWGMHWPIIKSAFINIPPLWFGFVRLLLATGILFLYQVCSRTFYLPRKKDLPILFSVGVLQMGLYTILANQGLFYVEAGRSAILGYTTPLWVAPMAVFLFGEHLSSQKLMGLLIGITGIAFLFNPLHFNWHDHNAVFGNSLLLLGALAWSITIVHLRFTSWRGNTLSLVAWQLGIGAAMVGVAAIFFQPHPHITVTPSLVATMSYSVLLATVFGYWASVEISQRLPAVTNSLAMLGVPAVGVLSSALFFNKPLNMNTLMALTLLIIGLSITVKATAKRAITNHEM